MRSICKPVIDIKQNILFRAIPVSFTDFKSCDRKNALRRLLASVKSFAIFKGTRFLAMVGSNMTWLRLFLVTLNVGNSLGVDIKSCFCRCHVLITTHMVLMDVTLFIPSWCTSFVGFTTSGTLAVALQGSQILHQLHTYSRGLTFRKLD